ncbi:MAG TPA: response regulator transcription factor [Rhodoblastus sp.]|nr:response regulator transcription factor [Rhodoblastus sp.]
MSASPSAAALPDDAPHLLVVDDDSRIRTLLSRFLAQAGYRVTAAADAAEARQRMASLSFDLIVLDVMMPGESGVDFAHSLRDAGNPGAATPILMLTARTGADDRIRGLEAGVDDYLPKPFEPRELQLRIAAILRRAAAPAPVQAQRVAHFGQCAFHANRGELRRAGEALRITDRERDILRALVSANGAPVSRAALAGDAAHERTIDVQVTRLRRKIEDDPANPLLLQTVRGAGYRLVLDQGERT